MNPTNCPRCDCLDQGSCESTIGLSIPHHRQCNTCKTIYQVSESGNVNILYYGEFQE